MTRKMRRGLSEIQVLKDELGTLSLALDGIGDLAEEEAYRVCRQAIDRLKAIYDEAQKIQTRMEREAARLREEEGAG